MLAPYEGHHLVESQVLTDIERATLVNLRDLMRRGEVGDYNKRSDRRNFTLAMHTWLGGHADEDHTCGTVGCIAGLCYRLSGGRAFKSVVSGPVARVTDGLGSLFLPSYQEKRTVAEAEHAITTFLETGEAEWKQYDT